MNITLCNKKLSGTVDIPAYEPVLIKNMICQALTENHDPISVAGISKAVHAAADCLEKLASVSYIARLDCTDSPQVYRYLLPVAASMGIGSEFTVSRETLNSTSTDFLKTLKVHGIRHEISDSDKIRIWGKLTAGTYIVSSDTDPGFISGLLFALPVLEANSVVMINGEYEDREEINETLRVLASAGIQIEIQIAAEKKEKSSAGRSYIGAVFRIKGGQKYNKKNISDSEGSWLLAAYLLTAGAICGGPIVVSGLNMNSFQKEKVIVDILKNAGAEIEYGKTDSEKIQQKHVSKDSLIFGSDERETSHIKVTGPWADDSDISQFFHRERLKAFEADAEGTADMVPALALLAAASKGVTCIKNVYDGTDHMYSRVQNIIDILEHMGIMIWESEGNLYVEGYAGSQPLSGGDTDSMGDPYIALMCGMAACISSDYIIIENAESADMVFPDFYDCILKLQD